MGSTGNPRIDNKLANQAAGFGNSTNAPQENLLGDDLHFTVLLRSDLKKGRPEQRGTGDPNKGEQALSYLYQTQAPENDAWALTSPFSFPASSPAARTGLTPRRRDATTRPPQP